MRIAIQGRALDSEVIKELLSPWNILFTDFDEADIVLAYRQKPIETRKTLVIPSEYDAFVKPAEGVYSHFVRKSRKPISISAGPETSLTIKPQTTFSSNSRTELEKENSTLAIIDDQGDVAFLTVDVVGEYRKILKEALDPKPSPVYRLLTGLPIPYTKAPKQLKILIMKGKKTSRILSFYDRLPLDALRFILARAIETVTKKKLDRKTWNGRKHALLLTHDIETRRGLLRARRLKKVENKYDVPAAWYIPSKLFRLDSEAVQELASHGEVGAHDTKHDGKLDTIPESKLIARLIEAREALEKILEADVKGFRAPLLQHSAGIIHAVGKAGYSYDTSMPSWEPRHPRTMKPHGIATIFPITIEGLTEIPVALPQDHQLLYVLGLKPKEIIADWVRNIGAINEMGGLCTILVHPDYNLAGPENLSTYEELLNTIASDKEAMVGLPMNVAFWQIAEKRKERITW